METILRHLKGDEQVRFLDKLLEGSFVSDYSESETGKKYRVIQSIMDEVNSKKTASEEEVRADERKILLKKIKEVGSYCTKFPGGTLEGYKVDDVENLLK